MHRARICPVQCIITPSQQLEPESASYMVNAIIKMPLHWEVCVLQDSVKEYICTVLLLGLEYANI